MRCVLFLNGLDLIYQPVLSSLAHYCHVIT